MLTDRQQRLSDAVTLVVKRMGYDKVAARLYKRLRGSK